VIRRPSGVNHGRMRRRVLGARVYGGRCVPTFLGSARNGESVVFPDWRGRAGVADTSRIRVPGEVRGRRTRRSSLGDGSQTTEPKVTRVEVRRVRRMAALMRSIAKKTKFTRSRPEKSRGGTEGRCCLQSVTHFLYAQLD
jgi:hypothetical protein